MKIQPAFSRCLLMLVLFLLSFTTVRAQWVTIPDTAFAHFLQVQYPSCMNGSQMDTTCADVTNANFMICGNRNIHSLDGIQYFDSLRSLECYDNKLTHMPQLPPKVYFLECSNNLLTSFAPLPSGLEYFRCQSNKLVTLPALPPTVNRLECQYNLLTSLPALPDSLRIFACQNNQIAVMPALPDSIDFFTCDNNKIAVMPALPVALRIFTCTDNLLTTLPALPANLKNLGAGSMQFSSFPVLPAGLERFSCHYSSFPAFPALPNELKYLSAQGCGITSIPVIPDSMLDLDCQYNLLTSLPALPSGLARLSCASNDLTALPALPNGLKSLGCAHNLLTVLPALPNSLNILSCANNQLTSIPELPDSLFSCEISDNPIVCLPELKRIVQLKFQNTQVTCLSNYGSVSYSLPPLNTLPLCGPSNPNGCSSYWNISGTAYADVNGNCIQDTVETFVTNLKVNLFENGQITQQTHSHNAGVYAFNTGMDTFLVRVDTAGIPFDVICPAGNLYTSVISPADSFDLNQNFGLRCKPGFDLQARSISAVRFFPGTHTRVDLYAGDAAQFWNQHCNTGNLSGQVIITFTGPVTYVSPVANALTPNTVSGDTLFYSISDWQAVNSVEDFDFILQTDTLVPVGQQVCITVSVTPTAGDRDASNNTLTICFPVVNSYDPNDKQVSPVGNIDTTQEWLTYTIRFQNTGTAAAQHIYIDDTLDTDLDESTFQLLGYSHQPLVQLTQNAVRFNFPNINLPDSTSDETGSHGYVQYKVKLKNNLAIGTQIENTAAIYFDFNPPVITNTVVTTFGLTCTPPVASIQPSAVTICKGDTVTLTASGGGTYVWSSASNNNTLTVAPPVTATFSVTVTDSTGCPATASATVTVIQPSVTTVAAGICPGESYPFNNQQLTALGIYFDTLPGANGCDSIVTLQLTIKGNSVSAITHTICTGGSYLFNNQTLTTSGTYYDTVPSANGCDSMITLLLRVGSVSSSSFSQSICTGASYVFNNQTLTTSGTYHDTLLNVSGCDSIVTLLLTVNSGSSSSFSQRICTGGSYVFNNQTLTTSGTYYDTLPNVNGCDSVITLLLTMSSGSLSSFSQSICTGGSYVFNNQTQTTSGTYYDTLPNVNGCDSIIILQLSVANTVAGSVSVSICAGDSYAFNNQLLTTGGTYYDTLPTAGGCDSIVTLQLSVSNGSAGSFAVAICTGDSYLFNNQNLTVAGNYYDTLINAHGCDSLLTLSLTVNTSTYRFVQESICLGDSYFFDGRNLFASGVYNDTLQGGGCDSVVQLVLTVRGEDIDTTYAAICEGEEYTFVSLTLTAGGFYRDTITNVAGCDSFLALQLAVHPLPEPVVTQNANMLTTGSFSDYQWLYENTIVDGETQQVLNIVQNGNYSVLVTDDNGCRDTSAVYAATGVGMRAFTHDDFRMTIYPNPNAGDFTLEFFDSKVREVVILDMFGKVVLRDVGVKGKKEFTLEEAAAGVYFVRVVEGEKVRMMKMLVWE